MEKAATARTPLLPNVQYGSNTVQVIERYERKTSLGFSVFNLMNVIMGSGILGLAYAMAESGVLLFCILLVFIAVATDYSIYLLIKLCEVTSRISYEDIGLAAFGTPGKIVTAAAILTQNTGSMSSYLFIIKTELPEILKSLMQNEPDPNAWYQDGDILVLFIVMLIILPLSCLPKIGFLGYTSSFSVFCMSFFMIVVIIEKFRLPCPIPETLTTLAPITLATDAGVGGLQSSVDHLSFYGNETKQVCKAELVSFTRNTAYAIPTMAFSFVCHTAIFPIYLELSEATKPRMMKVSAFAVGGCFFMYLITALFGYLTFYNKVKDELLASYSLYPEQSTLIAVVRLAVISAIIFHLPVIHFPTRISVIMLLEMMLPTMPPSRTYIVSRHICSTIFLVTVITCLAIFVPNLKDIFGIVGATSSTLLVLLLPSLFYLRLSPETLFSKAKILPWILLVSGFLILGTCLSTIIYGYVT